MSPLPTFYLHFTTFSGCSAPHHLAEIPNLLSWICFVGLLPKFTPRPSQDLYTEPLWNNSSLQDNFFVVRAPKTDTLCANAQLSWPVRWVSAHRLATSPKVLSYLMEDDTLSSVVCPSVYLEWVSVSNLFPNRSILKETFVLHSVTSFILHMGCIFKYFISKWISGQCIFSLGKVH